MSPEVIVVLLNWENLPTVDSRVVELALTMAKRKVIVTVDGNDVDDLKISLTTTMLMVTEHMNLALRILVTVELEEKYCVDVKKNIPYIRIILTNFFTLKVKS